MVIYGTTSKNLKTGQIINVDCPHCEKNTSMTYSVFGKYAHVYWIPFFPISKIRITECNTCKKTFEYKDLTEAIKTKFAREKEKNPVKTPIWLYSGLFIVAAYILFLIYDSGETKKNEAHYLKSPKVGDVYSFKSNFGFYSSMKVFEVKKDSLYVLMNEMQVDQSTGISKIDNEENYKEIYSFSKEQIKKMYKEDEIYEIERSE
jgi:hypothetical protein